MQNGICMDFLPFSQISAVFQCIWKLYNNPHTRGISAYGKYISRVFSLCYISEIHYLNQNSWYKLFSGIQWILNIDKSLFATHHLLCTLPIITAPMVRQYYVDYCVNWIPILSWLPIKLTHCWMGSWLLMFSWICSLNFHPILNSLWQNHVELISSDPLLWNSH